jgi:hypothetical protein
MGMNVIMYSGTVACSSRGGRPRAGDVGDDKAAQAGERPDRFREVALPGLSKLNTIGTKSRLRSSSLAQENMGIHAVWARVRSARGPPGLQEWDHYDYWPSFRRDHVDS